METIGFLKSNTVREFSQTLNYLCYEETDTKAAFTFEIKNKMVKVYLFGVVFYVDFSRFDWSGIQYNGETKNVCRDILTRYLTEGYRHTSGKRFFKTLNHGKGTCVEQKETE